MVTMHNADSTEALLQDNDVIFAADEEICQDITDVPPGFEVYKRRFYILFVFCIFVLMEASVCISWAPVSHTAMVVFGWDLDTLALLPAWVPIIFLLSFIPMMKLLLRFGLRVTTVHCTFLLAVGTGLRCLPFHGFVIKVLSNVCAIICGYVSSLAMMAPTAVTATWFPPGERTTATALMTLSNNNCAGAFIFLLAKLMVRDVNASSLYGFNDSVRPTNETFIIVNAIDNGMWDYFFVQFCICAAIFLCVLVYFPRSPPVPPCSSASCSRQISFGAGALKILRSRNFVLLLVAFAVPSGALSAFVSVEVVVLLQFHIPQSEGTRIGLFMALASIPPALLFSMVTDCRRLWMKRVLLFAVLTSGLFFLWFTLIGFGVFPLVDYHVFISVILGGVFLSGALPLFFEIGCEICYPVNAEIVTGLMTGATNFTWALILFLVMVKPFGTKWVTAVLAGSNLFAIPLLFLMRADYHRHRADSISLFDEEGNIKEPATLSEAPESERPR